MVRLELLQYKNPEGLHLVEEEWRNLARKLMKHNIELQKLLTSAISKVSEYNRTQELKDWKPFKFPSAFSSDEDERPEII